jgi:glycerophosphoryl diester phosphodiesterase
VIPRTAEGRLGEPTSLVANAHAHGLVVHPWTFRAENAFLPANLQRGTAPGDQGDLAGELLEYLRAGIDGFFTDQADQGVRVRAIMHR